MNIEFMKENIPVFLKNLDMDVVEFREKYNIECFFHSCLLHYLKTKELRQLSGVDTNINRETLENKIQFIELIKEQNIDDYEDILSKVLLLWNDPSCFDNIKIVISYYKKNLISQEFFQRLLQEELLQKNINTSNQIISFIQSFSIKYIIGIYENEILDVKLKETDFKYQFLEQIIESHIKHLIIMQFGEFDPRSNGFDHKNAYFVEMTISFNENRERPRISKKTTLKSKIEVENWGCPIMQKKRNLLKQELLTCINEIELGNYRDVPKLFNLVHQLCEYESGNHRELIGMRHLLHHLSLTRDGMMDLFLNIAKNSSGLSDLIMNSLMSINYFFNKIEIPELKINQELILNIKKHMVGQGVIRTKTLEYVCDIDSLYLDLKNQNRIVVKRSSFFPMLYIDELNKINKQIDSFKAQLEQTDVTEEISILEKKIKDINENSPITITITFEEENDKFFMKIYRNSFSHFSIEIF